MHGAPALPSAPNAIPRIPHKIVINDVTDVNGDGRIDLAGVEWPIKNENGKNVLKKLQGDGDPTDYAKYENYDAIEVSKTADIPEDWDGMMGVPDTFLDTYNPEQFEIVGSGDGDLAKEIGVKKNFRGRTDVALNVDGKSKCPYSRIIIRRRRSR